MKLEDLKRHAYLCPNTTIACRFDGLRFITNEPLRQLCKLTDGDIELDLVLAAGAALTPGLSRGDHVDVTVGIRMGRQWARIEVLALKKTTAKVTVTQSPSMATAPTQQLFRGPAKGFF